MFASFQYNFIILSKNLIRRYLAKRWKQNVNFITTVRINESAHVRIEYRYFEYEINANFWCGILLSRNEYVAFSSSIRSNGDEGASFTNKTIESLIIECLAYSSLSRRDLRGNEYSCHKRIESDKWEIGMRMLSWQNGNILSLVASPYCSILIMSNNEGIPSP